jgi:hypothetical protein
MAGQITTDNVERTFGSVPVDETHQKLIVQIEMDFVILAKSVLYNVPQCSHRSAALRKILEAKFLCTDAIAKGGEV